MKSVSRNQSWRKKNMARGLLQCKSYLRLLWLLLSYAFILHCPRLYSVIIRQLYFQINACHCVWSRPSRLLIFNRPFPSSLVPLFQSECKCETILMKMTLICMKMKLHFHMKGFALSLILKQRHKRTRKWPIAIRGTILKSLHDEYKWMRKFWEILQWGSMKKLYLSIESSCSTILIKKNPLIVTNCLVDTHSYEYVLYLKFLSISWITLICENQHGKFLSSMRSLSRVSLADNLCVRVSSRSPGEVLFNTVFGVCPEFWNFYHILNKFCDSPYPVCDKSRKQPCPIETSLAYNNRFRLCKHLERTTDLTMLNAEKR